MNNTKCTTSVVILPQSWYKKGWLDIPKFYKYFYTISKGNQFRELEEVKKYLDDEWFLTYKFNDSKSYKWLVNVYQWFKVKSGIMLPNRTLRGKKFNNLASKRENSEKFAGELDNNYDFDSFRAQIFEEITSIPSNINNFLHTTTATMTQLTNTSVRVDNMCLMIEEMMNKITSAATMSIGIVKKYLPMIQFIVKIMALGYMLTIKENQTYSSIAALLTLILPSGDGSALLIGCLNRVVQGIYGMCAQDDTDTDGLIMSFFKLTKNIMASLFCDIPSDVFKNMVIDARKVKLIGDFIRGSSTIVEFLLRLLDKLISLIGDGLLKYYGVLPWFLKEDRITPLIDEFVKIKLDQTDKKSQTNKHAAKVVLELHEKVVKFEASFIKQVGKGTSLESARVLPYIRIMSRHLDDTVRKIPDHLKTGKNPRRIKPFWAYIYGDPRVGKTSFFQPLLINALVKALKIRDQYEDYAEYTYFRNCGDEYWEKYAGQPVLWYNDLFQNFKDEQAMNNAVMELTNVVDDNLYCLNMAFEDKGAIFFDSELVVSNAQSDMIGLGAVANLCLSGGLHLYARRNVVLEFSLDAKYKGNDGLIDTQKVNVAIASGIPQIADCVPLDMYNVKFHNPVTGAVIKTLPFLDAVKDICLQAKGHKEKQTTFKDKLYKYYEDAWSKDVFAMAGDNLKPCGCNNDTCRGSCRCVELISRAASLFNTSRVGYDMLPLPIFGASVAAYRAHHTAHVDDSGAYAFCLILHQLIVNPGQAVQIYRPNERDSDVHHEDTFYDAVSEFTSYDQVQKAIDNLLSDLTGSTSRYRIDRSYTEGDVSGFVQQFIAVNRTCDEDVIGRVSLCLELANGSSFDKQTKELLTQSMWAQFKHHAYKAKEDFVANLEAWMNVHPNLTIAAVIGTIITCCYAYIGISTVRTVKQSIKQSDELYEKYNKVPPKEFGEYIRDNYKYVPNAAKACTCGYYGMDNETTQSAEGKNTRSVPQIRRERPQIMVAQAYEQQNRDIEMKVATHVCKVGAAVVHDGVETDLKIFGSALNVGGDVFVIPKHFYVRWKMFSDIYKEKGDEFKLYFCWTEKMKQYVPFSMVNMWDSQYNHHKDIVFIQIKNMVQMSHMAKFFVRATDDPNLYDTYLYGLRVGDFTPSIMQIAGCFRRDTRYTHGGRIEPLYGVNFPDREIVLPDSYVYESSYTLGGDCGLVLFNNDSRLNSRKLMGIHTAGSLVHSMGITSPLYQEDILEALEYFKTISEPLDVQASEYVGGEVTTKIADQLKQTGISFVGGSTTFTNPLTGKERKIKLTIPNKTKISKSVMYDIMAQDFGPAKTAPAQLSPIVRDGEKIFPIVKAASKMAKIGPVIEQKLVDPVVEHMASTIVNWRNKYGTPRVLTNHEMINGFGSLKQIDMSTSPGFPYTLISAGQGKLPFFDLMKDNPKEFAMKPYLEQQLKKREDLAKRGVILETVFVDTLKDETRPLEKVEAVKTRLFQVAPMDFNMLLRKYFGWFTAVCQDNFIEAEMAVGINANSYDWTLLADRLLAVGTTVGAGDCSNHDASCLQQVLMEIVVIINDWYNDGPENARVRRVLFATFLNSLHMIEDFVYRMLQGNKSGITLTTIVNCLMEMFIVRLAYYTKFKTMVGFSKHISTTIYGDDIVNTLSDEIKNKLLPTDFVATYKSLGFEYTTVDKHGENDTYYNIDNVTYLKRRFAYDKDLRVYKAQLDRDVIYEICRWSESDPTNMEDQLNRINSSLLELSNYDRDEFQNYRLHMIEYCGLLRSKGFVLDATRVFDWNYCQQIKYPHIFS